MSTDVDRGLSGGDESTARKSRLKLNVAIGAAIITAAATIISAFIISSGKSATPPSATSVSPGTTTGIVTAPPSDRRSHYAAAFRGSTVDGEVSWFTAEPPQVSGMLKLQGSMAHAACSIRVSFEVRGATSAESLTGGESKCGNTSTWPIYNWSVPAKSAAAADRIDILVKAGNDVVARISCTRSGDCRST